MSIVGCNRDSGPSNLTDSGGSGGSPGGSQDCGPCIDVCRLEMLACAGDAVCDDILRCSDTCAAGNRHCVDACSTSTPNGDANEILEKLIGCVSGKCESNCGFAATPR